MTKEIDETIGRAGNLPELTHTPQRRGSGRTTAQMINAPKGAIFVWCNEVTRWADNKARELGRRDLVIIGPHDLTRRGIDHLRGREYPAIVFDHAIRDLGLDDEQWRGYMELLATMRP